MADERELDAPLMAYLGAAGYKDVHLTHGPNEIGKDIIAQRDEGVTTVQYALQTKRGDIGLADWRGGLREQMWEAARLGIAHPSFDANLTRQAVLVLTGRLIGTVQQQIDELNATLLREGRREIAVWHVGTLIDHFNSVDASTIYPQNESGYSGYGRFFSAYGLALDGRITPRRIERHSRNWLLANYDGRSLLIPTIEAAALYNASERANNYFAALRARLALVRVTLDAVFHSTGKDRALFTVVAKEAIAQAIAGASRFAQHVWCIREGAPERKLIHAIAGNATFLTYPLLCTQLGEALALIYFGSPEAAEREEAISRLRTLVTIERGISKVFSDDQTVSVVMIVRALASSGDLALARSYLRATAYELLNLYANRLGMASLEDDERGELDRLLGVEFPSIRPPQRRESFMATAIVDLCAYLGDDELYASVVNDIRVNGVLPRYYRALDTRGQFRIDGDDVVFSVNVGFTEELPADRRYGEHLVDEPDSFELIEEFGPIAFLCLSALLRDRYFPSTWLSDDAAIT